jgi:hypothetical protein
MSLKQRGPRSAPDFAAARLWQTCGFAGLSRGDKVVRVVGIGCVRPA